MRNPVTGLYVPGSRPERFAKAVATGAELVILDLEDAVAPAAKDQARLDVVAWFAERYELTEGSPVSQVRINPCGMPWHQADLAAIASLPVCVEVRLPKVESIEELDAVATALPGRAITPILETARGIERAGAIAEHPAVTRLSLGESDLRSDLGSSAEAAIEYARIRLLYAARAAGLAAPMLSAYPAIADLTGLADDTARGRALGASGRVAIHPSQLAVIAAAFVSTPAEIAWARQVQDALRTSGDGVARLPDGAMVDPAMSGRAAAILAHTP